MRIAVEGSCLFSKSDGPGVYTNNLIENLALIEKKDLFNVYYPNAPLFRKSPLKVKQHNIKPKRFYFGINFNKCLDVYHDTSMTFAYSASSVRPAKKLVATVHDTSSAANTRRSPNFTALDALITPSETLKQEETVLLHPIKANYI